MGHLHNVTYFLSKSKMKILVFIFENFYYIPHICSVKGQASSLWVAGLNLEPVLLFYLFGQILYIVNAFLSKYYTNFKYFKTFFIINFSNLFIIVIIVKCPIPP